MTKVLIIIPCFNEEAVIYSTVVDLKKHLLATDEVVYDILVVNDCSTDNSLVEIKKSGVKYLNLAINLGIGGAMQTGYLYAQKHKFDIAVQFDGDGQHPSTFVSNLITPILSKKTNVVIGSRFVTKEGFQSSFLRRIGIQYFSLLNRVLVGTKVLDATSGFRAIDSEVINTVCNYYPENYPEPEAIVLFSKQKYAIVEIPVLMQERKGGVSSISGIWTLFYMFKVSVGCLFLYIRLKSKKKK